MKTKELQFDGNIYICRIVKSNEGEELLIGSTALINNHIKNQSYG